MEGRPRVIQQIIGLCSQRLLNDLLTYSSKCDYLKMKGPLLLVKGILHSDHICENMPARFSPEYRRGLNQGLAGDSKPRGDSVKAG